MLDRGLGYRKDIPSADDVRLGVHRSSLLGGVLPEADQHLVELAPPVMDQGSSESCVGQAIACAGHVMQAAAGMEPVLPSPGFIWWNSRKSHGDEGINVGTYMRNAFHTLRDLGIAPEAFCPVSEIDWKFAERPSFQAYQHAFDAKFEVDYIRLDADDGDEAAEQVKSCIVQGMPVAFGMLVPKSFLSLGTHDIVEHWGPGAPMAGGHAMCVIGYDARGVIVQNSWGKLWGNQGLCHLSWDFFRSGWVDDKWAIRRMPQIG